MTSNWDVVVFLPVVNPVVMGLRVTTFVLTKIVSVRSLGGERRMDRKIPQSNY